MNTKIKIKKCKKHGETEFTLEGRGYYRCKKCRSEAVIRRRKKSRTELLNLYGNACYLCGYNKCQAALQFHHIDTKSKLFALSHKGLTRNFNALQKEAEKCILVCSNCHAEIHFN